MMDLHGTRLCVLLLLGGSWIVSADNRSMPQTCGPDKFQCKSGQCIDETHKCDGSVECSDGSDETQTTCGNQIENVLCGKNDWSAPPSKCEKECGRLIPKGVTYVKNGKEVEVGEFPWHVGLYFNKNKIHLCGGSLISRTLVLTAAHCFKLSNNPESYTVIAGKFHRDWNTVDGGEQRLSVKSIETMENYAGIENMYSNDIGILVLNSEVNITEFVSPVCLDYNKEHANFNLREGSFGKVAGWGINENDRDSEKLQTANLPFVGYNECKKSVLETFRPFIINDKFCARNMNGTSICQGHGGEGLVFESVVGTEQYWFLQGVASVGEQSPDGPCKGKQTLFTKVVDYMDWVLDILNKYRS